MMTKDLHKQIATGKIADAARLYAHYEGLSDKELAQILREIALELEK